MLEKTKNYLYKMFSIEINRALTLVLHYANIIVDVLFNTLVLIMLTRYFDPHTSIAKCGLGTLINPHTSLN